MEPESELTGLMVKSQQGDRSAYQELLERVETIAKAYVTVRMKRTDDVWDVVQEVLVSVHHSRNTYSPDRPFMPWLIAIVKRRLYDYFRKVCKMNENEFLDTDLILNQTDTGGNGLLGELDSQLSDALEQLSDRPRQIIRMLKVEGYKVQEVASKLDMSESAVKTAAHRGYRQMKSFLQKTYGYYG